MTSDWEDTEEVASHLLLLLDNDRSRQARATWLQVEPPPEQPNSELLATFLRVVQTAAPSGYTLPDSPVIYDIDMTE